MSFEGKGSQKFLIYYSGRKDDELFRVETLHCKHKKRERNEMCCSYFLRFKFIVVLISLFMKKVVISIVIEKLSK